MAIYGLIALMAVSFLGWAEQNVNTRLSVTRKQKRKLLLKTI